MIVLLVSAAALTGLPPAPAQIGQCYDYPDTGAGVYGGIPTCAGWGVWCIECVAGGASCIHVSGFTECIMHQVP
ncbi:MAG: hypothetical protein AAF657_00700 [Acidobacteriota bacterium]